MNTYLLIDCSPALLTISGHCTNTENKLSILRLSSTSSISVLSSVLLLVKRDSNFGMSSKGRSNKETRCIF